MPYPPPQDDQTPEAAQPSSRSLPAWSLPAWPVALGALALWLAALFVLVSLTGYHPGDPLPKGAAAQATAQVKNHLGLAGAFTAGVLYDLFGLAAWLLVGMLALSGGLLLGLGHASPLTPLAAAALWITVSGAALLGQTGQTVKVGKGALPLGGNAGKAMAGALESSLGPAGTWAVTGTLLLAGLFLAGWATWPLWGPAWRRRGEFAEEDYSSESLDDEDEAPVAEQAPRPLAAAVPPAPEPPHVPAAPAVEPPVLQGVAPPPAVEPPAPAPAASAATASTDPGPRIKPRLAQAPVVEPPPEQAQGGYLLPPLDILQPPQGPRAPEQDEALRHNSQLLERKLQDFGVQGRVMEVAPGPVVTMYEFKPAPGVKISKVAGLADDLAMNLRASSIRIVAPIPGKAVIGIEIPNAVRETVFLRELLAAPVYQDARGPLAVALGKDILGQPVVDDLARMPHLLIAGATGSGKSVFINTLVLSILYRCTPSDVRLLMVDPKRIELSTYNDIPHLLYPIITSPKEATSGLRWAVAEMERRYELLAEMGVRNISSFNQRLKQEGWLAPPGAGAGGEATDPDHPAKRSPLPYIVVIIDELADLMMVSSKEVETLITRLAQMARAAGIHLVLATQRPSVDVITGLIKANFPARISFQVSSRVDSRTILDTQGAEHLLGAGDLLFLPPGTSGLKRLHAAYVSDREIEAVVDHVKAQARPQYDESIVSASGDAEDGGDSGEGADERYADAVALVKQTGSASISFVQRKLRVGYNRAARMIEQMEQDGIVGPSDGSRPREVLIRD
jgi:S-DNA-T family DNA segregation ATPase FtsK/SpoIIIE